MCKLIPFESTDQGKLGDPKQMPIAALDPKTRQPTELVFALVAAVGTPIEFFIRLLEEELGRRRYTCVTRQLSSYTSALMLETPPPAPGCDEYTRIRTLMKRGDEIRRPRRRGDETRGDVLALLAIADIHDGRRDQAERPGTATILRQIKHPDEVYTLRQVYEDGFHLIGLYCPRQQRRQYLEVQKGMHAEQAEELISIDEHEPEA